MHVRTLLRIALPVVSVLLPLSAAAEPHSECPAHPKTLRAMRHCYRALLVFTPSLDGAEFKAQAAELQGSAAAFHERDLLFVPIVPAGHNQPVPRNALPTSSLSEDELAAARHRFHVADDSFLAILLGKDGGEKLSSSSPLSVERLTTLIDAMPMRQEEEAGEQSPPQ